jgi:hypothetical protein
MYIFYFKKKRVIKISVNKVKYQIFSDEGSVVVGRKIWVAKNRSQPLNRKICVSFG